MVFLDLSNVATKHDSPKLAPVADRVLGMLLDFLLFSPLFSVLASGLLRKLQYRYYVAPESTEFWVFLSLTFLAYSALMILCQGLFWSVFGATPGQQIFQLRVIQLGKGIAPTLSTALLRSSLFWLECCLLGIPLLEVFSQHQRRPFHDRATETSTVTLKKRGMAKPQLIETRLVRGLFTFLLAFSLVWAVAEASRTYRKANNGGYKSESMTANEELCEAVPNREARLDAALAMYWVGALSSECLSADIDFAFWKGESEDQAWASFATALLNEQDKALSEAYLGQACEKSSAGAACLLATWWADKSQASPKIEKSWMASVSEIIQAGQERRVSDWDRGLSQLPADFDIPEFVQSEKIKLMWAQNKISEARGGYQVVFESLPTFARKSLASDLCFSELTFECKAQTYSYCRDLAKDLGRSDNFEVRPEWLVALAEESACSKSTEKGFLSLARDIEPESEWGRLVLALTPESGWPETKRLDELRKIAFSTERPTLFKARAFLGLLRTTSDLTDLEKGQSLLSLQGLPFQHEAQKLFMKSAQRMGYQLQNRLPASAPTRNGTSNATSPPANSTSKAALHPTASTSLNPSAQTLVNTRIEQAPSEKIQEKTPDQEQE